MTLAIRGIGAVGGFGCGIQELEEVLTDSSAFYEKHYSCKPDHLHGRVLFSSDTKRLEEFVPKKALRRMDHFSKMALLAAFLSLRDAGVPFSAGPDTGIIIASGYGSNRTTFAFLDSVMDHGDRCGSPTHFSNSVHNSAAAHISIALQGYGPSVTVSCLEMSIPAAFLLAELWLSEGRVESVLLGGVDEHSPVLEYCWSRCSHTSPSYPPRPLDPDFEGASIGEGAVFFLLSKPDTVLSPYAYIDSVQMGNLNQKGIFYPENALILAGADGHKTSSSHYQEVIPHDFPVASFTPFFGSLPIGIGFDAAVAALSLKRKISYAMPKWSLGRTPFNAVQTPIPIETKSVCCVKITPGREYGMLVMTGAPC